MSRTIALIHAHQPALALQELLRKTIVLGCATALILAGRALPF
jgi:hypothetical protein